MTHVKSAAQIIAEIYLAKCKKAQILANSPGNAQDAYEQTMVQLSKDQTPIVILDDDDDNEYTEITKTQPHPPSYHQAIMQPRQMVQRYYSPNPPTIELDDSMEVTDSEQGTQFQISVPNYFQTPIDTTWKDRTEIIDNVIGESTDLHIMGERVLKEWIDISELAFEGPTNWDSRAVQTSNTRIVTGQAQGSQHTKVETNKIEPGPSLESNKIEPGPSLESNKIEPGPSLESPEKAIAEAIEVDDDWADLNVEEDVGADFQRPQEDEDQKETETPSEKFKCDHCPYKTNWKGNITKHIISRHQALEEINWYECAHCSYKAKTKEYLKIHLKQVHEQIAKRYKCNKCSFRTWAPHILKRHNITQHLTPDDIEWFKCEHCDFKCKIKRGLRHHVLNRHTDSEDIQWFKCEHCPYKAKNKKLFTQHVANKHTDWDQIEWFKCDKCDYMAKAQKVLRMHVKAYHTKEGQPEWGKGEEEAMEKELQCQMCGFKTYYKMEFKKHFRFDGLTYLCK